MNTGVELPIHVLARPMPRVCSLARTLVEPTSKNVLKRIRELTPRRSGHGTHAVGYQHAVQMPPAGVPPWRIRNAPRCPLVHRPPPPPHVLRHRHDFLPPPPLHPA